jgi:hypothetical protein
MILLSAMKVKTGKERQDRKPASQRKPVFTYRSRDIFLFW